MQRLATPLPTAAGSQAERLAEALATLNEALRRGACGYLIKPFPRRDLELMMRDALARRVSRVH